MYGYRYACFMEEKNLSRIRKSFKAVAPLMIVLCCVAAAAVFWGLQTPALPDNPLAGDANPSHMLLTAGGDLPLSEDAPDDTQDSGESGSSSQPEEPSAPAGSDVSGSAEEGSSEPPAQDSAGPADHTGASGAEDTEVPGDHQKPSGETSKTAYFTTTIRSGETVDSRSYRFSIRHLQPELTVKTETVSVNGVRQVQFGGSVLLDEGTNSIRVAVRYTDPDGRVLSVYRDYTVYVRTQGVLIETDLTDRTVDSETLSFAASASCEGKKVPVSVLCGGQTVAGQDGVYTVPLKPGKNTITLSAVSGESRVSRVFTVTCTADFSFGIRTDLADQTVHEEQFSFSAALQNGSGKARLTVVQNGKTVAGTSPYQVSLKSGSNVIRLKATDTVDGRTVTVTQSYTIRYVPVSTEETVPRLSYSNVTDGMTVTGSSFTMNLKPVDYQGRRLYYNNITVRLNGTVCPYTWDSEFTSYLLYLNNGSNTIEIRITDSEGRYADYSYTVRCTAVKDGDPIGTVTISMDANVLGLGSLIQPASVTIYEGESAAACISRFLEQNGFSYEHDGTLDVGFYLKRIGKPGVASGVNIPQDLREAIERDGQQWSSQQDADSIGEFDYCEGSGWMWSQNGFFPNHGLSDAVFKDGDVIRIRYTLVRGKDIGGFTASGGEEGENYDKVW